MIEIVDRRTPSAKLFSIIFAASRESSARVLSIDLLAVLVAALLPWSTTGVSISMAVWVVAVMFTLDLRTFLRSLLRPASALPLALFILVVIGTLWAEGPWFSRLQGINPSLKLLAIPFLLYHFERSERGVWVFVTFLVSCTLLLCLSWIVVFEPGLKIAVDKDPGVPIKNYIDQSQEFALCMFGLALPALTFLRLKRFALSAVCVALMLGFLANMMFVVSARTALVYLPVLLALFAIRELNKRTAMIWVAGVSVAGVVIWFTSPVLRERITNSVIEYDYYAQNIAHFRSHSSTSPKELQNSLGLRLEYWQKSLKFFVAAPIFGNGTGSTKQLFERDAVGESGLAAEVTRNPHNQTLNVAVQWGLIGVILLWAMWLVHLRLFREGEAAAWIGLLVVVQNIVSSLFNSHLFDFVEGWIYMLGVGIAGGITLGRSRAKTPPTTMK